MRFGIGRSITGQGPAGLGSLLPGRTAVAVSPSNVRKAWLLAILADFLQIVLFPLFGAGVISPANDLLDLTVAVFMIRLLGWHPALLPTFIAELIPGLGLFPTWTLSVWIATQGLSRSPQPRSEPTP